MNDPLDAIFETPEESLAHFLKSMPKTLVPVFQREFMRRPTTGAVDGGEGSDLQAESTPEANPAPEVLSQPTHHH